MSDTVIGIYGASGYGKEVLPLVREQATKNGEHIKLFFIDDAPECDSILDYDILSFASFLKVPARERFVVISIANSMIREKLVNKCNENNIRLLDIAAQNVIILDKVLIEPGYILSPFVTLTSDIVIGKSFQANIYSYIAHDCKIGDYVTFAPGVRCNGNIEIRDHAYLGTGAILKQGKPGKPLTIGKGAIVGAGAVVTKSVPDGMTVFGNPAIEFTKENVRRRS